jgi:hypothetical protein
MLTAPQAGIAMFQVAGKEAYRLGLNYQAVQQAL